MKVTIVFANKKFILKQADPNSLMTHFLDKIKSLIDAEFPLQYSIQHMEYSITDENQTLSFSCRTMSKEPEEKYQVEEIQNLLTNTNLKKIFNMGNTGDINEITITPTQKRAAFERIDGNTVKIDPYFADYCARHLNYCKDMLKRNIQNIFIEYEQKTNNKEYCTKKIEEVYVKNNRLYEKNTVYHLFACAILRNDAFKNKLLSSGIRTVHMKKHEEGITLEVEVSSDEKIYSFCNLGNTLDINEITIITRRVAAFEQINHNTIKIDPYFADYCARHLNYCKEILKRDMQNLSIEYTQKTDNKEYCVKRIHEIYNKNNRLSAQISFQNNAYHLFSSTILRNEDFKNKLLSSEITTLYLKNNGNGATLEVGISGDKTIYSFAIEKCNLLTPNSESCPQLTVGLFATKINGEEPDPEERKHHLLSSSTYF